MRMLRNVDCIDIKCNSCDKNIDENEIIKNSNNKIKYCDLTNEGSISIFTVKCPHCKKENEIEEIKLNDDKLADGKFVFIDIYKEKESFKIKEIKSKDFILKEKEFIYVYLPTEDKRYPELLRSFYIHDLDVKFSKKKLYKKMVDIKSTPYIKINHFVIKNINFRSESELTKYLNELNVLFMLYSTSKLKEQSKSKLIDYIYATEIIVNAGEDIEIKIESKLTNDLIDFIFNYGKQTNKEDRAIKQYIYGAFCLSKEIFVNKFIEQFIKDPQIKDELKTKLMNIKSENVDIYLAFAENREMFRASERNMLDIVNNHIDKIEQATWDKYIDKALNGTLISSCLKEFREDIVNLSRKDFVEKHICETQLGTFDSFKNRGELEKVGEINSEPVYYHPNGFYFYENKKLNACFDIILTTPAYPYYW